MYMKAYVLYRLQISLRLPLPSGTNLKVHTEERDRHESALEAYLSAILELLPH